MMKMGTIVSLLTLWFLCGCISISPKPSERKKADNLSVKSPPNPYQEIQLELADRAWQNRINGNTISYMSSCDERSDATLNSLFNLATLGIEDLKIIEQSKNFFNDRESLRTHVSGKVDGIPVQINLTIFKKRSCTFNISYVANNNSYTADLKTFNHFLSGFRVP